VRTAIYVQIFLSMVCSMSKKHDLAVNSSFRSLWIMSIAISIALISGTSTTNTLSMQQFTIVISLVFGLLLSASSQYALVQDLRTYLNFFIIVFSSALALFSPLIRNITMNYNVHYCGELPKDHYNWWGLLFVSNMAVYFVTGLVGMVLLFFKVGKKPSLARMYRVFWFISACWMIISVEMALATYQFLEPNGNIGTPAPFSMSLGQIVSIILVLPPIADICEHYYKSPQDQNEIHGFWERLRREMFRRREVGGVNHIQGDEETPEIILDTRPPSPSLSHRSVLSEQSSNSEVSEAQVERELENQSELVVYPGEQTYEREDGQYIGPSEVEVDDAIIEEFGDYQESPSEVISAASVGVKGDGSDANAEQINFERSLDNEEIRVALPEQSENLREEMAEMGRVHIK
jgi:hypothetical protein